MTLTYIMPINTIELDLLAKSVDYISNNQIVIHLSGFHSKESLVKLNDFVASYPKIKFKHIQMDLPRSISWQKAIKFALHYYPDQHYQFIFPGDKALFYPNKITQDLILGSYQIKNKKILKTVKLVEIKSYILEYFYKSQIPIFGPLQSIIFSQKSLSKINFVKAEKNFGNITADQGAVLEIINSENLDILLSPDIIFCEEISRSNRLTNKIGKKGLIQQEVSFLEKVNCNSSFRNPRLVSLISSSFWIAISIRLLNKFYVLFK